MIRKIALLPSILIAVLLNYANEFLARLEE